MKTVKEIREAIDAVVEKNFPTEKTYTSFVGEACRIFVKDNIHDRGMLAILGLVKTIETLNPDRSVFFLIGSKSYREYDDHINEALGLKNGDSVPEIFIFFERKEK